MDDILQRFLNAPPRDNIFVFGKFFFTKFVSRDAMEKKSTMALNKWQAFTWISNACVHSQHSIYKAAWKTSVVIEIADICKMANISHSTCIYNISSGVSEWIQKHNWHVILGVISHIHLFSTHIYPASCSHWQTCIHLILESAVSDIRLSWHA